MTSTQDIKLLFPSYDCQPNQRRFDKFLNDLLASGGSCDVEGWSLADCLNRTDAGAITPLGAHAPDTGGIIRLSFGAGRRATSCQTVPGTCQAVPDRARHVADRDITVRLAFG